MVKTIVPIAPEGEDLANATILQAVDIQQHNDTDEDGQPYLLRVAQNICVVIEAGRKPEPHYAIVREVLWDVRANRVDLRVSELLRLCDLLPETPDNKLPWVALSDFTYDIPASTVMHPCTAFFLPCKAQPIAIVKYGERQQQTPRPGLLCWMLHSAAGGRLTPFSKVPANSQMFSLIRDLVRTSHKELLSLEAAEEVPMDKRQGRDLGRFSVQRTPGKSVAQQSSSAKAKPADDTGADSPHQNPVRSNQTTEVTAKTLPRGTAKTLPRGTLAANRMQAQAHSASMPAVEPRDADASTTEQAPGAFARPSDAQLNTAVEALSNALESGVDMSAAERMIGVLKAGVGPSAEPVSEEDLRRIQAARLQAVWEAAKLPGYPGIERVSRAYTMAPQERMRWATNLGFYRILGSWLCRISSDSLAQSVSGTANSVTAAILDALARTPFSETFIFWINRWGVFKQVTKLAETAAPEIKASAAELQGYWAAEFLKPANKVSVKSPGRSTDLKQAQADKAVGGHHKQSPLTPRKQILAGQPKDVGAKNGSGVMDRLKQKNATDQTTQESTCSADQSIEPPPAIARLEDSAPSPLPDHEDAHLPLTKEPEGELHDLLSESSPKSRSEGRNAGRRLSQAGLDIETSIKGPQEVESCQPARQPATKAQPKPLQDLDAVPSSAPVAPPEQGALNSVFRQDQIDLLGERLTDVEVEELRLLEDNRDMPDYNAKVDQLIAAKMVAYGIATYEEIFPGSSKNHAAGRVDLDISEAAEALRQLGSLPSGSGHLLSLSNDPNRMQSKVKPPAKGKAANKSNGREEESKPLSDSNTGAAIGPAPPKQSARIWSPAPTPQHLPRTRNEKRKSEAFIAQSTPRKRIGRKLEHDSDTVTARGELGSSVQIISEKSASEEQSSSQKDSDYLEGGPSTQPERPKKKAFVKIKAGHGKRRQYADFNLDTQLVHVKGNRMMEPQEFCTLAKLTESWQTEIFVEGDAQERCLGEWLADRCHVCESPLNEDRLLLCSNMDCEKMFHIYCLDPPLDGIPPGDWYCPDCVRSGDTTENSD